MRCKYVSMVPRLFLLYLRDCHSKNDHSLHAYNVVRFCRKLPEHETGHRMRMHQTLRIMYYSFLLVLESIVKISAIVMVLGARAL